MSATAHGTFHWNELLTNDVEKAKTFFAEVIGWSSEEFPMEEGRYWIMKAGDVPVAGIMQMIAPIPAGTPPHWLSYLAVDDVDARLQKAKAAGATLIREPFDIPGVGRIAIVGDPTGGVMGWITPAT
jgi:predicted enzyme related to lactoylglutathione lyase